MNLKDKSLFKQECLVDGKWVKAAGGEVPFGGVKMSGMGREGGRRGIEDYVETKYILMSDLDK